MSDVAYRRTLSYRVARWLLHLSRRVNPAPVYEVKTDAIRNEAERARETRAALTGGWQTGETDDALTGFWEISDEQTRARLAGGL